MWISKKKLKGIEAMEKLIFEKLDYMENTTLKEACYEDLTNAQKDTLYDICCNNVNCIREYLSTLDEILRS